MINDAINNNDRAYNALCLDGALDSKADQLALCF